MLQQPALQLAPYLKGAILHLVEGNHLLLIFLYHPLVSLLSQPQKHGLPDIR